MFDQIMVPVDLNHTEQLKKSLRVAADVSKLYDAPVCYVGVTGSGPTSLAHNPAEFEDKLKEFAKRQSEEAGHQVSSRSYIGHDLVADVDDVLLKAVKDIDADLVVMASHMPSIVDYVWPSNGGKLAAHSDATVFVVR